MLNRERRLAFFTAVNIDGVTSMRLKRERDRWFFDPRLPADVQTGEEAYRDNPLDRGHLVRRLDPAWGASRDEAKRSNDDTFHFTNCCPSTRTSTRTRRPGPGSRTTSSRTPTTETSRSRVFTGPVFADDDEHFAGVQLPRQFWKVVVMVKESGELSATGYLLSQEELIAGLEVAPEAFSYGAYRTFQVTVRRIEELTGSRSARSSTPIRSSG